MKQAEKILIIILIVVTVLAGVFIARAQDTSTCDANPVLYEYFGTHCLHPVTWNIPEMEHPIGSVVGFITTRNDGDFGIVHGYFWNREESRYYYGLVIEPNTGTKLERGALVAPENILYVYR